MQTTTKNHDGSPDQEGETANNSESPEEIKVCQYPFCGCISAKGYTCMHDGPCDPCDESGRHFSIQYVIEGNQRYVVREYNPQEQRAS